MAINDSEPELDVSGWSEKQKAELALKLLQSVSTSTLSSVTSRLLPLLHRDFLVQLPIELASHILSFTDLQTVARASLVCRQWWTIAHDNSVWKTLFNATGFKVNENFLDQCLKNPGLFWEGERRLQNERWEAERRAEVAANEETSATNKDLLHIFGREDIKKLRSAPPSSHLQPSHAHLQPSHAVRPGSTQIKFVSGNDEKSFSSTLSARASASASPIRSQRRDSLTTPGLFDSDDISPAFGHDSGFLDKVMMQSSVGSLGSGPSGSTSLYGSSPTFSKGKSALYHSLLYGGVEAPSRAGTPPPTVRSLFTKDPDDERYSGLDWKHIYKQHKLLQRNWRDDVRTSRSITGHDEAVYCLQFDDDKIISGSRDDTIRVWDMKTGALRSTLAGHTASVLCLQYDGQNIVSGSSDATMILWDLPTGRVLRTMHGHTEHVLNVRFDRDHIVSASRDKTIKVWTRKRNGGGECRMTLRGHRASVNCVQLNGGVIVSASGDRLIKLWSMETGEVIRSLQGHEGGIACVQYDGRLIASGSSDTTIKVWDVRMPDAHARTLTGHTDLVRTLQFDANRLVSGSYDETIKLWDIRATSSTRTNSSLGLGGRRARVTPPTSPESPRAVDSGTGSPVSSSGLLHTIEHAHAERVFKIQFDEARIVSCSEDKVIRIWDYSSNVDARFFV
ncbi:WD40-repeat-containing domain protein [Cladochytrium replicatum]|nr:WD40-repeat-containing domain protein [Cladochytrium replicatum]